MKQTAYIKYFGLLLLTSAFGACLYSLVWGYQKDGNQASHDPWGYSNPYLRDRQYETGSSYTDYHGQEYLSRNYPTAQAVPSHSGQDYAGHGYSDQGHQEYQYTSSGYGAAPQAGGASVREAAAGKRGPKTSVELHVRAQSVESLPAVPEPSVGAEVRDFDTVFPSQPLITQDGRVRVEVGAAPVYVVEYVSNPAHFILSSPFGLHPAHTYKNHPENRGQMCPPSEMGCDFAAAHELGIGWNRPEFYSLWFFVQPTREHVTQGRYEWKENDYVFGANPRSIQVLGNIGGIQEQLARISGGVGGPGSYTFPDDDAREAFVQFVTRTVERYDGDGKDDAPGLNAPIKHWQIDNEPAGRSMDWQGFAEMFTLASRAVRSACTDCKVSMGGVMLPKDLPGFFKPVLQRIPKDSLDFFDFHFFDHGNKFNHLEPLYHSVRAMLDDTGFRHVPIWVTEVGTYSGAPMDRGTLLPFKAEWVQAADLVKIYTTLLSLGVEKVFWAFGMVEGFTENTIFENTGLIYDGKGLHDQGFGKKKLAFHAYRKLIGMLVGSDFSRTEKLSLEGGVTALKFVQQERNVYVLWRDGASVQN